MRLSLPLAACIFLWQTPFDPTQGNAWRGLKPLQSTRAGVERLLGDPIQSGAPTYQAKGEWVKVVYSEGPCDPTVAGSWNVSVDTVIRLSVTPEKDIYVESLHLDESKYRKLEHPHIDGLTSYVSEDGGVVIEVRYGKVITFIYGPTSGDKRLACPPTSP